MVDIKRGIQASLVVTIIFSLLSSLPEMYFSLTKGYYLIFIPALMYGILNQIILWLPSGILFAAVYNKLPEKIFYKSAIFTILPALLLLLESYLFSYNPYYLFLTPLTAFIDLSRIQPYVAIIAYSFIGSLLLAFFWEKRGKKK